MAPSSGGWGKLGRQPPTLWRDCGACATKGHSVEAWSWGYGWVQAWREQSQSNSLGDRPSSIEVQVERDVVDGVGGGV